MRIRSELSRQLRLTPLAPREPLSSRRRAALTADLLDRAIAREVDTRRAPSDHERAQRLERVTALLTLSWAHRRHADGLITHQELRARTREVLHGENTAESVEQP